MVWGRKVFLNFILTITLYMLVCGHFNYCMKSVFIIAKALLLWDRTFMAVLFFFYFILKKKKNTVVWNCRLVFLLKLALMIIVAKTDHSKRIGGGSRIKQFLIYCKINFWNNAMYFGGVVIHLKQNIE